VTLHLAVLAIYSLSLMLFGLWSGRRARTSADFLVAGRQLGPGLLFSTMLAANIGAGSTVGATAHGYSAGLSAWWWVGSAAIGSTALALWVGPALRRVAAVEGLRSVGDYLEFRYDRNVRGIVSLVVWIGSLLILSSQLIGLGWMLNVVAGIPKPVGAAIGGAVITVYFAAGGLLTSARVNVMQLAVKVLGFAIAVPLAVAAAGGWSGLTSVEPSDASYWSFWRSGVSLGFLVSFAPAFIVSPGLLQKILGARDDRTVRLGVGLNALGLLLYAGVPVVLGVAARGMFPELADSQQALPMILTRALPPLVGAIGLAAVFSAEISAADAVLLMLTTSLSQDLYQRFLAPDAGDERVLRVARAATLVSGTIGVAVATTGVNILTVVSIFYTLLTVSLVVPIIGGLFLPQLTTRDALTSILAGVSGMLIIQLSTHGRGWGPVTPALGGLVAAMLASGASHALVSNRRHRR
jgi:SSS family solute:Na+ symporter